jgi:pyruvate,water dikinase
MGILEAIKGIFSRDRPPPLSEEEAEALRTDFQSRYQDFRALLTANNQALDLMAQLESSLTEGQVIGTYYLRARCTALGVKVYSMIKHLNALAQGRYQVLFQRFDAIQDNIEQILKEGRVIAQGPLVMDLADLDAGAADRVGGKMANLGEVASRVGLPTPPGFVLTATAYNLFFTHNNLLEEINRRVQAKVLERTDHLFALSSDLGQLIVAAEMPPELAEEIDKAYARLEDKAGKDVTVSVRSSALGEDAAGASFAGQYRSQLNVRREHLELAVKEVIASKYSPQAMQYRHQRGLKDEDLPMCVGILAMIDAEAGGVAYTVSANDPGDRDIHLSAAWGLPKGVVDGNAPADLLVVSRAEPPRVVRREIAKKSTRFDCFPEEGVCRLENSGDKAEMPALSDGQALELGEMALVLEEHYGTPQDVEWALDREGRLLILQTRPLRQSETEDPAQAKPREGALISGGVKASPGAAAGKVFKVSKDSDALRFEPGSVLVVDEPWPRWAALLARAAALVSARGGLAGHLATVAREYQVPALFGVGQQIEQLQDGQEVTVDAGTRAVYPGRVEDLLAQGSPRPSLMRGSPVHKMLKKILENVTPLNLLNPDGLDFQPQNVRTLHDITRFCHEMSVRHMFDFGKEHHFPQRASKQLYHEVPMQYWVINLDDGFGQEVTGKYVELDNIVCIPMLAVWEGIIAVPWAGPPSMSGKGFASVMFESTVNPALGSPFKKTMADRNYFMVSKNYMNLQSRFGYHFCTVEALVGERAGENYATFGFAGGAADQHRRQGRVALIADILGELGFRVDVTQDTLRGRVENLHQEEMERRLKMIGYLLMHTRQLDVVMDNPAAVRYYRGKMLADLERFQEDSPQEQTA